MFRFFTMKRRMFVWTLGCACTIALGMQQTLHAADRTEKKGQLLQTRSSKTDPTQPKQEAALDASKSDMRNVEVAVLDVMTTGVSPRLTGLLTEVVGAEVSGLQGVRAITTTEAMRWAAPSLGKQTQELSAKTLCADDRCLLEIGQALGVAHMMATHVGRVGNTHVISARLLSTQTAGAVHRVQESFQGGSEVVLEGLRAVIHRLFAQMGILPQLSADESMRLDLAMHPGLQWPSSTAWSVWGGAVAGAAAGVAMLLVGNTLVQPENLQAGNQGQLRSARHLRVAGHSILGVSGAAALAGGALWYWGDRGRSQAKEQGKTKAKASAVGAPNTFAKR